jgi:hypothetical protein
MVSALQSSKMEQSRLRCMVCLLCASGFPLQPICFPVDQPIILYNPAAAIL